MKRILIVEDEEGLLDGLAHNFRYEGYDVLTAKTGTEGLKLALKQKPDVMILDIMLPEKDGFTVLEGAAPASPRPSGAGDHRAQLRSRRGEGLRSRRGRLRDEAVRNQGSRGAREASRQRGPSGAPAPGPTIYKFGDVEVRFEPREVMKDGKQTALSYKEFELLKYMIEHRGRTVSREELLEEIWGVDEDLGRHHPHGRHARLEPALEARRRLRATVHRRGPQGGLQVRGAIERAKARSSEGFCEFQIARLVPREPGFCLWLGRGSLEKTGETGKSVTS